ncbi:MAG: hypothetical protein M3162_07440 [Thermoproteota archaeon]|nr:hypothetical protein [Thermoproteota archaeon]
MGNKNRIRKGNNKLNKNSKSPKRNIILLALAGAIAMGFGIGGFMLISATDDDKIKSNIGSDGQYLTGNWMDIHGIGVISNDRGNYSLYIATHNGLFKKDEGSQSSIWHPVGNDNSDLMGFAVNPGNKDTMYSSGHPTTGGNLGFRVSDDYGITWQKVSDVTTPLPIDFHTMTVGNNPEIVYGASGSGNTIYISADEGKTWTAVSSPNGERVLTLTANKTSSNVVYASTTNGLFYSEDQGKTWKEVNTTVIPEGALVSGIEISPDGKTTYAFVVPDQNENAFMIKSTDGAKTWSKTEGQIKGVKYTNKFAFGGDKVYAIVNQEAPDNAGDSSGGGTGSEIASSVYSSTDGGKTWVLEGTNNRSIVEA